MWSYTSFQEHVVSVFDRVCQQLVNQHKMLGERQKRIENERLNKGEVDETRKKALEEHEKMFGKVKK